MKWTTGFRLLLPLTLFLQGCGTIEKGASQWSSGECPATNLEKNRSMPGAVEAHSLTGKPLQAPKATAESMDNWDTAWKEAKEHPNDLDRLIWLGRRTAYLGRYREALDIYTAGLRTFPNEPRLFRHRGHRYISLREFDKAIVDLKHATVLMREQGDRIELDGLPNAQNIPLSTLYTNSWYHLGLAYYLKGDWLRALHSFEHCRAVGNNDDNWVSASHWLYMIHRKMGDDDLALSVLVEVEEDMDILENFGYHRLCLFYRGDISEANLVGEAGVNPSGDAVLYGLANWYLEEGKRDKGVALLQALEAGEGWASFGHIAAEAELIAIRGK